MPGSRDSNVHIWDVRCGSSAGLGTLRPVLTLQVTTNPAPVACSRAHLGQSSAQQARAIIPSMVAPLHSARQQEVPKHMCCRMPMAAGRGRNPRRSRTQCSAGGRQAPALPATQAAIAAPAAARHPECCMRIAGACQQGHHMRGLPQAGRSPHLSECVFDLILACACTMHLQLLAPCDPRLDLCLCMHHAPAVTGILRPPVRHGQAFDHARCAVS